jgi:hypothetical protein
VNTACCIRVVLTTAWRRRCDSKRAVCLGKPEGGRSDSDEEDVWIALGRWIQSFFPLQEQCTHSIDQRLVHVPRRLPFRNAACPFPVEPRPRRVFSASTVPPTSGANLRPSAPTWLVHADDFAYGSNGIHPRGQRVSWTTGRANVRSERQDARHSVSLNDWARPHSSTP